ncbi:RNA polymerase ECF-type sigma factor [Planctomycetales bacterium 10988]|nr:RNA polymerase ECF-type sigma factor [Planctomycetales bacterium 10988]
MSTATLNHPKSLHRQGKPKFLTDEELLLRYRTTEDRLAFEQLVQRYESELYNYLRRYLGDTTLAEDAFQGTFLQLHLKCHQFEEGLRVRPWLYTIATHQAIDALRKAKRHRMVSLDGANKSRDDDLGTLMEVLSSKEDGPSESLQDDERRDWIRQAVLNLPDHLRAVVVQAYYQGLKYREIAEALDLPLGTVKSRLHAAVKKLNEVWSKSELAGDR